MRREPGFVAKKASVRLPLRVTRSGAEVAKLSVGGGTAAAVGTFGRGSGVATGASGERIVPRSTAVSVAVTVNRAPFAEVLGFGTATSAL
jgi:hypothetical protein